MSRDDDDEIEGELMVRESDGGAMIEALTRGEIDVQINTAKKYPRSIDRFLKKTMQMATLSPEIAESMFYSLPRGRKPIEGPSVRMAEVVAMNYGNIRYGARVVHIDDKFVTAQGMCHDLETNNATTIEVKRRITNKDGVRFNDDMIQVTSQAACSIALRNAIFRIVPRSLFQNISDEARKVSVGDAVAFSATRAKAFDWYKKAGATEEQILAYLGRAGIDEVDADDVIHLRGMVTAIKDGELSIDAALIRRDDETSGPSKVGKSSLGDQLKADAAKKEAPPKKEEPPKPKAKKEKPEKPVEETPVEADTSSEPEVTPPAEFNFKTLVRSLADATTYAECEALTKHLLAEDSPLDDVTRDQIVDLVKDAKQRIKESGPQGGELFNKVPHAD